MNNTLPTEKKLTVNLLIEAGCLGPNGTNHVKDFCFFAEKMFASFSTEYISWDFAPREKKSLPEISYTVCEKKLALDQVSKYLQIFKLDRENFEEQLNDRLAFLIEQYLQR
ncbi:MAG: hypothetical protein ACC707_16440 [Thiohalomonadales bacterium]